MGSAAPARLPEWLEAILACPACLGPLVTADGARACADCGRRYPDRHGIPDFRLEPDPFIGVEAEERKVARLLAGASGAGWRELVARYYAVTPENPPALHRRYVRSMEAAEARGAGLLDRLEAIRPGVAAGPLVDLPLVDLGCGTCGLTLAAARRGTRVVGVDVALRWLAIGRRRLRDEGRPAPLLCANAEVLPFRPAVAAAVVGDAVLEHVRSGRAAIDETLRVLEPGGAFLLSTNNRYSLLPEPHVRLWGFGLLPRRWMEPVARAVRRTPYRARLRSRGELERILAGRGRVVVPAFAPGELGPGREPARRAWEALRRFPPTRAILARFGPLLYIEGRKPASQS